jgi:ferredoxin/flavodoxin---NADP+ reductase
MGASPDKFYAAHVTCRRDIAPDLWILRLDPGGKFNFVAGQYATLGLPTSDSRIERPYSIASSPYEAELEFFLELVPHGGLTPLLHKLQPGADLTLRKTPKGLFTLDVKSSHRKHLLVCTVTGVAPYTSYIRTLYADWKENRFPAGMQLFLIQGASRSWEFGYREELEAITAGVPWLTFVPTISRFWEDAAWTGERGRVEDVLRKYVDLWQLTAADTTAYFCGHPLMMEHGTGILERAGFPKASIKREAYWVPKKA